jgi:hypothetical protein
MLHVMPNSSAVAGTFPFTSPRIRWQYREASTRASSSAASVVWMCVTSNDENTDLCGSHLIFDLLSDATAAVSAAAPSK